MRMDAKFDAAARAAMHCEEFLARPAPATEEVCVFGKFAESVAASFAPRLASLLGAEAPEWTLIEAETMFPSALAERLGASAGNLVLPVGESGSRLFASFALKPLLSQLNRIFGGGQSQEADDIPLQPLPASLAMLLLRLERLLIEAMGDCLDSEIIHGDEVARMEPDFADLAPFPAHGLVSVLEIRFAVEGEEELSLLLACRKSALQRLLSHWHGDGQVAPSPRRTLSKAMEDIELNLRARLVDMAVPAGRLMSLAPGQVLPISVARSVPLFAGNMRVATGSVGELDDRVALQLETVLFKGETL